MSAVTSTTKPGSKGSTILLIAIAIFSLGGLADALYLTVEHIPGQSVRCTITSGCSEVLSSSYATVAGYPLAGLGAVAYFSVFSLAILALFGYRVANHLLLLLVSVMFLMSVWLLYLQTFVIHAFCQFCLLSAGITTCITIMTLTHWYLLRRQK
jgi:uncharacterized membrane protein